MGYTVRHAIEDGLVAVAAGHRHGADIRTAIPLGDEPELLHQHHPGPADGLLHSIQRETLRRHPDLLKRIRRLERDTLRRAPKEYRGRHRPLYTRRP